MKNGLIKKKWDLLGVLLIILIDKQNIAHVVVGI